MKELNDVEHRTIYYATMYEYAAHADISHYAMTLTRMGGAPPMVVSEFQPAGDPDMMIDYDHPIYHAGKIYVPICWGENEPSAILESVAGDACWVRYIPGNSGGTYVSDGIVYPTEKAARAGQ